MMAESSRPGKWTEHLFMLINVLNKLSFLLNVKVFVVLLLNVLVNNYGSVAKITSNFVGFYPAWRRMAPQCTAIRHCN